MIVVPRTGFAGGITRTSPLLSGTCSKGRQIWAFDCRLIVTQTLEVGRSPYLFVIFSSGPISPRLRHRAPRRIRLGQGRLEAGAARPQRQRSTACDSEAPVPDGRTAAGADSPAGNDTNDNSPPGNFAWKRWKGGCFSASTASYRSSRPVGSPISATPPRHATSIRPD